MNKVATFQKVSFDRFFEDVLSVMPYVTQEEAHEAYQQIKLPKRATQLSAGHDIYTPFDIQLGSGQDFRFPTGIRCKMNYDVVMLIAPRSSIGIKKNLMLNNTLGVIDADYYQASNEGEIWMALHNYGSKPVHIDANDRVAQAVFVPYGVADVQIVFAARTNGIGSTGE